MSKEEKVEEGGAKEENGGGVRVEERDRVRRLKTGET